MSEELLSVISITLLWVQIVLIAAGLERMSPPKKARYFSTLRMLFGKRRKPTITPSGGIRFEQQGKTDPYRSSSPQQRAQWEKQDRQANWLMNIAVLIGLVNLVL